MALLALAGVALAGCSGGEDEAARPGSGEGGNGAIAGERAGDAASGGATPRDALSGAGLPAADAVRRARTARLVPPLGRIPRGSRRLAHLTGSADTNHFEATIVAYLPPGWSKRSLGEVAGVPPRQADGMPPDLVLGDGRHYVVVSVCHESLPASAPTPGLDDPTGDQTARAAASRWYQPPMGSLEHREPPRLAPHVYRAAHMVAVPFRGGGCLLLGDPGTPDPTAAEPSDPSGDTAQAIGKAIDRAGRRRLPSHLVTIAKRITAHWGGSARLPASNLRAEAIARRAQRAALAAPALRYEEQLGYCHDGEACEATEGGLTRVVERERASGYVFADVVDQSQSQRTLLVRTRSGVLSSPAGDCWEGDPYEGTPRGGFLFRGYFSHGDDRAAFFPPLRRWHLSYEPPVDAGDGRTELRWRSFFDRGTAIVDNASMRLVRMERVLRATGRVWRPQRVSFTYPDRIKRVRTRPRCRPESPYGP